MPTTYQAERDFRYGLAFGNVATGAPDFDPAAPSTGWLAMNSIGLPVESTITFEKNPQVHRPFRASGFRNSRIVDVNNDSFASAPSFTLSMPATFETLDLLLAACFQKVTEGAVAPYVKDYVYPEAWVAGVTQFPDFSADAGGFFTLICDAQAASASEAILCAVGSSITLSCSPTASNGRLMVSMDCLGKYHYHGGTYAGTLTYPTSIGYWDFNKIQVATINAQPVMLYGFSFKFDTSIKPIPAPGYFAGGRGTQTYALTFLNTTGSIDIGWDANARTFISHEDTAADFDPIVINWNDLDPVDGSGEILFKANAKFNKHSFLDTEERKVRLEFDTHESGSLQAFEVHMANGVDRGSVYTAGIFV